VLVSIGTGCRTAAWLVLCGLAAPLHAQPIPPQSLPGLGGALGDPGSARQLLPEITPAPIPRPEIILPPLPAPAEAPRPSRLLLLLREVRIEGNSALSDEVLQREAAGFIGREVDANDLEELRRKLTLAYVERGYITSGAVLPDQQIVDGIVTYRIIEGRIAEIDVAGESGSVNEYVRARLGRGVHAPVDIRAIERSVQLLLQDPLVERLNVELQPGIDPGTATLRARVKEASPYSLGASVANNAPPNTGSVRGALVGTARNVLGMGEALTLQYGHSSGADDGSAALTVPISAGDTRLSLHYDYNESLVIEAPFQELDIRSRTKTFGAALSHPFIYEPSRTLVASVALDNRTSKTTLLDTLFSFSPGVREGTAHATVLRVSQDFVDRGAEQVIAARSTFNFGLPIFGATVNPDDPTARFQSWLGQAQLVRQVFGEHQVLVRANVQLTRQPLFSFEQFAVGGINTVRGYRENTLVRDNGVTVSLEGRIALARLPLPFAGDERRDGVIELAPFYDFGRGWNKNRATPTPREISSVGIGVRWDASPTLLVELYYGRALYDVIVSERDLQDSGVHFRLTTRLF
jgi:hemolysin activation/secretion protein